MRAYRSENSPDVASSKVMVFNRQKPLFACLDAPVFSPHHGEAEVKLPLTFLSSLTPLLTTIGAEMAGSEKTLYLDKADAACSVAELLSLVLANNRVEDVLTEETRAKLLRVFQNFPYEIVVPPGSGVKKKKKVGEVEAGSNEEKAVTTAVRLNVNMIHVLAVAGASGKLLKKMGSYLFGEKSYDFVTCFLTFALFLPPVTVHRTVTFSFPLFTSFPFVFSSP